MRKYTQKELRNLVANDLAVDITQADNNERTDIINKESYIKQIGYASGTYGCNGMLFGGHNTGTLYAITTRSTAIYVFG